MCIREKKTAAVCVHTQIGLQNLGNKANKEKIIWLVYKVKSRMHQIK